MSTFSLIVLILVLVAGIAIGSVAIYRNNKAKFSELFDQFDKKVAELKEEIADLKKEVVKK